MKNINIRKWYYHAKHSYITMNNIVIAAAIVIGASWTWGSIEMMQRNYTLQGEINDKLQQERLASLQVQTLTYSQNYYKSSEYQDLAMRKWLGVTDPGEKALILPPNSQWAKDADAAYQKQATVSVPPESNLQQWVNFLFGVKQ